MILQDNISAVLSMCRSYGIEATVDYITYYCEHIGRVKTTHYIWEIENVAPMEYIKRK